MHAPPPLVLRGLRVYVCAFSWKSILNRGVSWLPLGPAAPSPQASLVTGMSSLPPLPSRMHTYILFPSSSALRVCFGNLPSAGLAEESLCLEFCCRHVRSAEQRGLHLAASSVSHFFHVIRIFTER